MICQHTKLIEELVDLHDGGLLDTKGLANEIWICLECLQKVRVTNRMLVQNEKNS